MDRPDEFLLVLNKMGFRTIGGGAVGGRISYSHPHNKETTVSLRLHPMDGRVLDFNVSTHGKTIATGTEPKQLLRTLQDKGGSGKFRKQSFIPDPSPFKKITASMYEDLDEYGNNIERAISEIFQLDEQVVQELVNKMKFEEYLNLAMALDQENISLAEKILQSYGIKSSGRPRDIPTSPTSESVVQHINYLSRNNEDNIVTPEFKQLKISEQKEVLNELLISQLQKMLANLRGYAEPGMYESALFSSVLKDEIILKSGVQVIFQSEHHLKEVIPNVPNKPNSTSSDTRLEKDAEVAVANATGETEDGTVVNDTGNMVTVQTKTGRKTVKKSEVMQPVVDENAIDIKRFKELAGIKAQPIQKQVEEIEEEEITEDDNSLGTNYTLEIDGEDVKKNDEPEDLITYAGEHGEGLEWMVYDTETGDVAATWDGTGFLQDAAKSSSHREGKLPGWEREEEARRAPEVEDEDEWNENWYLEHLVSDKEAKMLSQKVVWKIGENWPDGDPMDAVVMVMRRNVNIGPEREGWDQALEKVKIAFEKSEGTDFYGYFNQLTDQMQADNPGRHGSERFAKGGGGRATGQWDDVPRL